MRRDPRLRRAALAHAEDMVRRRYFRHDSLDGATFLSRIAERRYAPVRRGFRAGENLAWGAGRDGSPQAIVRAWMTSPPHRRVLLTRRFRDVGIGIRHGAPVRTAEPAATYVAEFGRVGFRPLG